MQHNQKPTQDSKISLVPRSVMDEETIRKRCIELTAGWLLDQGLVGLVHSVYRAAYADGLKAAASYIASLDQGSKPSAIAAIIRNHAKEMGHE